MSDIGSLLTPPRAEHMLPWDRSLGRRFMLFVDTEEAFDWSAPFDRSATQVAALGGMAEGQARFSAAGVTPVYLCDYPMIASDAAVAMLRGWREEGTADIGAHLHPWVNPPHEEAVSTINSFAGNLPEALERAKLAVLTARIEARIGARPVAFRAGRYGAGPNTARLLVEAGYRLDCSVRSRFNYAHLGGPDYSGHPLRSWHLGTRDEALITLPLSTAYVGAMRALGGPIQRLTQHLPLATGLLSRTRLLSRIPLSPEGTSPAEAIAAIDALIAEDVPVLSLSFHSPSLEPGHTPYVRTAADLRAFWHWWSVVLDHMARCSVTPMTLAAFLSAAESVRPGGEHSCQAM